MKAITLRALCLFIVLMAAASAQGPSRCDAEALLIRAENQGRLVSLLNVEPAAIVEATRDCPGLIKFSEPLLMNAALSGDVGLRPMLREIVDNRAYGENEDWWAAEAALVPLAWLGEEPSYFLDLAQVLTQPLTHEDDQKEIGFGVQAATAVSLHPDSSLRAPLAALAAAASQHLRPGLGGVGLAVLDRVLALREAYGALPTVRERVAFTLEMGWPAEDSVCKPYHDRAWKLCDGIDPESAYVLTLLRDLAAVYPDSVRTYLPLVLADWYDEPVDAAAYAADPFAQLANRAALPFEPFPAPSEDTYADVEPVLECVEEQGGEVFVAYFGYRNQHGVPVTVPRGTANVVVPSALDGRQPEAFAVPRILDQPVGRTAPFPGFAWRAPFAPDSAVTWTLPGGSATASAASPRCGDPQISAVPRCDGRAATIYVAADGIIVGGPDAGQPYADTLRGSTGDDVIVGTDGPDEIDALDGDDMVCALGGDDIVYGRDGDDVLFGGADADDLFGDAGTDTADGGDGLDGCEAETLISCDRPPTARGGDADQ